MISHSAPNKPNFAHPPGGPVEHWAQFQIDGFSLTESPLYAGEALVGTLARHGVELGGQVGARRTITAAP